MKKTFTLGIVLVALLSTNAQAQEACDTTEDCQELKTKVEARLAELKATELTGVLKTGVDQYEAEKICMDKGMRLPTARELALLAQSLGAQGISETKKYGYSLVKGTDVEGNLDYFYFRFKNYTPPQGKLGEYVYWSSSVHPDDASRTHALSGTIGYIDVVYRGTASRNAVRCVRSR